jgi:charged multivesicular body protein 1
MDQFEKQFEDMDVQSEYIEQTINTTTALTTPQGEVDDLIGQIAAEHGLELTEELGRIVPAEKTPEVEKTATEEQVRGCKDWKLTHQDVLSQRLARLKQM